MRTRASTIRLFAAACVLTASTFPLIAYDFDHCAGNTLTWGSNSVWFVANNSSFPTGGPREALNYAMAAWNAAPGSNFRFLVNYTNSGQVMPNGSNEIIFSSSGFDATTLAITKGWHNCVNIAERDVIFNANRTWSYDVAPSSLPNNNGAPISFPLVAMHELGHAMGLNHQTYTLAIMSAFYPNGGPVGQLSQQHFQPLADDVEGARVGYGTCCGVHDLFASAYGSYNENQTGPIIPASNAFRSRSTGFGFSVGNRGTLTESNVRVEFYFSTDRWIDTSDTYLGATTLSLAPGANKPASAVYFTLPMNFPVGTYYFGYIVDPQNQIAEADETNNAVAMGTATVVPSYTPPSAYYTAAPTSGVAPLTVNFDGTASSDPDGYIASYTWSFGDGAVGFGPYVSHVYDTPGTYWVTLTVTDNQGYTEQYSDSVWSMDPSGCLICD